MALLVISSAFLLAVTGCKKSNSSNSGTAISATINGTAWSSNLGTLGFYVSGGISGGEFDIEGGQLKSGDTTAFDLTFLSPFTLNQAVSSDTSEISILYSDVKTTNTYEGTFGVGHFDLTITAYDSTGKTIGGTFSGVLYNVLSSTDSIEVTNGKFNSSFTVN
jgi:hypothetical protein